MSLLNKKTKLFNIIALVLVVVIFAFQCIPFWSTDTLLTYAENKSASAFEENTSASISAVIWFPGMNETIRDQIDVALDKNFSLENLATYIALQHLLSIIFILLVIKNMSSPFVSLIALAQGLLGGLGFFLEPSLRLSTLSIVQPILSFAIVAVSLVAFVVSFFARKKATANAN